MAMTASMMFRFICYILFVGAISSYKPVALS